MINSTNTQKKPNKKHKQGTNSSRTNCSKNNGGTDGIKIIPVGDTSALGLFKKKKSLALAKNFFDIKDVAKKDCKNPIELPNAKFERYYFDLIAKGYIRNTEYYLVTQPDKTLRIERLFIFKNPPGTANPPVFIPAGKQIKKLYDGFKDIFKERYVFEE